jgi:chemotaxis protein methyltransferase CheR
MTVGDLILEKIRHFVHERSGLSFAGHKKGIFRKKVEGRVSDLEMDAKRYWSLLQDSQAEQRSLFDILTTNETLFFRNPRQFSYLMERIVPEIEAARGREVISSWGRPDPGLPRSIMTLRVLCAGCSTGEEPYSVAMALFDALRYPKAWDIRITAGDISEKCLSTAAAGFYEEDRLKTLPQQYRDKYMEPLDGGAVVRSEIRETISFVRLNLRDVMGGAPFPGIAPAFPGFDIVFCRNVMIYFSPEGQQQLVDTLSRSIAPGGYLFTGDAEPLHLYSHELEPADEAGCLIYRKAEKKQDATAV